MPFLASPAYNLERRPYIERCVKFVILRRFGSSSAHTPSLRCNFSRRLRHAPPFP
jgi:hypothetical protein